MSKDLANNGQRPDGHQGKPDVIGTSADCTSPRLHGQTSIPILCLSKEQIRNALSSAPNEKGKDMHEQKKGAYKQETRCARFLIET